MTNLGELLGLGTKREQIRINHDLNVIRRHGIGPLRDELDGTPVPAGLYLAALARIDHRAALRDRWAVEDHLADQERRDRLAEQRGGGR